MLERQYLIRFATKFSNFLVLLGTLTCSLLDKGDLYGMKLISTKHTYLIQKYSSSESRNCFPSSTYHVNNSTWTGNISKLLVCNLEIMCIIYRTPPSFLQLLRMPRSYGQAENNKYSGKEKI